MLIAERVRGAKSWSIALSVPGGSQEPRADLCPEFEYYREAQRLAAEIADQAGLRQDLVFSDAMHVAVALALEDAGMVYTKPNVAWMFERICPGEVREILLYRRDHPDDYDALPMAGTMDKLTAAHVEAAGALEKMLAPDWLNAFFYSGNTGKA
jgi:hypothetical protein